MDNQNTEPLGPHGAEKPEAQPYRYDSGNSAGLSSPANREAKRKLDNHIEQNTGNYVK